MCGLLILCDPSRVTPRQMDDAFASIAHRGIDPYSRITYTPEGWIVAHHRLPINGLSPGVTYPRSTKNGDIWFVGEVYDFPRTDYVCDADFVCDNYFTKIPGLFDGMYHFLFRNRLSKLYHLVMDPMGKKPIYYRADKAAYASEIKALTRLGPCTLNEKYMAVIEDLPDQPILKLKPTDTAYNEIVQVNPGYRYRIGPDGVPEQVAKMTFTGQYWRSQPYLEKFFKDSVHDRCRADASGCILVSGGLDSAMVYAEATLCDSKWPLVHVVNGEDEPYIQQYFPEVHLIEYPDEPSAEELLQILYYNETPLDLGSMVPQWYLGKGIKEKGLGPIVLTGDGADELFMGYRRAEDSDTRQYDYKELRQWHLPRLDKLMMAHTLEVRCPFLSLNMVRYAKNHQSWPKDVGKIKLKQLAETLGVPFPIRVRKKYPLKSGNNRANKPAWNKYLARLFRQHFAEQLKW